MNPKDRFFAFLPGIALILASFFSSGCAHRPFPSEEIRGGLGQVGLSIECLEGGRLYVPAAGAGTGAAKGAGTVLFKSVEGGAQSRDPIGFALGIAVGIVGAPIGAVVGAVMAMPAEEAETADKLIRRNLEASWVIGLVKRRLMSAARENELTALVPLQGSPSADPASHKETGIASLLEIRVSRVGLLSEKWGSQPPLSLVMQMVARLVRVHDSQELFRKDFMYLGSFLPFACWSEDGGAFLVKEADEGCRVLADQIIESFFLREEMWSCSWNDDVCGPRPEYPEPKWNFWKMSYMFEPVGSLRPILRWQPFSLENRKGSKPEPGTSQVSYDLKIWKKDERPDPMPVTSAPKPVYERRGLPHPSHELESPLEPNTRYFWSVRVRIRSERGIRLSDWAFFNRQGNFRFSTPPLSDLQDPPS